MPQEIAMKIISDIANFKLDIFKIRFLIIIFLIGILNGSIS